MESYIVQEGDNIITIARRFGVRIIDIITTNNLSDATYLEPGTELIIPRQTASPFTYHIVKKGDTLYSIAEMHNISVDDLVAINGLKKDEYLHIDQRIMVPAKNTKVYITKEGETLKSVSDSLKIPQAELISVNEQIFLLPEQMLIYKVKE